jgi:hypothetical protein
MNNSPASSYAKRLIRRYGAGSTTPHPESLSLIGDLRPSVELTRQRSPSGCTDLWGDLARRLAVAVRCSDPQGIDNLRVGFDGASIAPCPASQDAKTLTAPTAG